MLKGFWRELKASPFVDFLIPTWFAIHWWWRSFEPTLPQGQKKIEDKLRNARTETAEIIKTTSIDLQKKTASELVKLDKDLDKKIDDSANDIEKNKNDSINQIHDQIHEITKLILLKITNFKVSNLDVKDAVITAERKIH